MVIKQKNIPIFAAHSFSLAMAANTFSLSAATCSAVRSSLQLFWNRGLCSSGAVAVTSTSSTPSVTIACDILF